MNRLPKYYAIQQVDDPRWNGYITHINSKRTDNSKWKWSGTTMDGYYGYDGRHTYGGTFCVCVKSGFQNNPTMLTLDQFEEMTFELPEKWYVIRNEENASVLNEWNNETYPESKAHYNEGAVMYSDKSYGVSMPEHWTNSLYTKITFDQFLKYVVKPVVPAFDKNNWIVETSTDTKRLEVAEWIDAQGKDRVKAVNHEAISNTPFIGWGNGHLWFTQSDITHSNRPRITWEQFQSLKTKTMETIKEEGQLISRENLKEIYVNVCSDWQEIIESKLKEDLFAREILFDNKTIARGFNQAGETQKVMLRKYFTQPVEDKNMIPIGLTDHNVQDASRALFNESGVLNLLLGATPSGRPELKGRGLLISDDYIVETGKTTGNGTWISIHRK